MLCPTCLKDTMYNTYTDGKGVKRMECPQCANKHKKSYVQGFNNGWRAAKQHSRKPQMKECDRSW